MRRSSQSSKKGQWFLISAVFVTSAFLAMSIVLRGSLITGSADEAGKNEQYYFYTIMNQFDQLLANANEKGLCGTVDIAMQELRAAAIAQMEERGYKLIIDLTHYSGCSYRRTFKLVSEHVQLTKTIG
ncbi:MAG: hypothetical protein HY832_00965 [Candidatus Aenigmarchaeota archaeon]|nr:hypothetical protein [Candidatus Aenigmarchaeota archaeon]